MKIKICAITTKALYLLLAVIIATGGFFAGPAGAVRADTDGDYTYSLSGGNATITGYTGPGGAVVIPATLGGYPVTSIGASAFHDQTTLTSVTIPNSVTGIGSNAFNGCSRLTGVTIGSGVTSIGYMAFTYCQRLTSVTIPASVTSIGKWAFARCSLTSVTIPAGVTSIGDGAFEGCWGMSEITVAAGNTVYSSQDGILFNKIKTSILQYPCGKSGSYVIPVSVTSIGNCAFEFCTGLTSVTIPAGVTSIGEYAFRYCSGLTSVTIPAGVISIGYEAFRYCSGLTAAYFLGNAPSCGTDAFNNCHSGFTVYYISGKTGWTNPWYGYPTAVAPPFFLVTSPYGGETWGIGKSKNITWTSSGVTAANVKIELSRDGGATYTTIIASTPNDGTQAWTVTAPVTATALIRVTTVSTTPVSDTSAVFAIAALPVTPTLVSPTSGAVVSTLTPTLDWSEPAGAVSYGVQVSTVSTFATTLVNQSSLVPSTYTVPGGLNWNTTYYWRANAANAAGNSAWSTMRTFKTALGPPPLAPSGLTATAISSTGIGLTWVDNSDNEAGFKVERKKAGTTTFALVATVGPNVITYSNTTGLTANTQYFYRVRAYNFTSNYSAYCTEASATTWPLPPLAPTLILPASGAVVSTLTPTLDWNEPVGAVTYGVQVSAVSTFATTLVNQSGLVPSTYTVPGATLNWNTTYYWRANALDFHGAASRWSTMRTFKTALGPPPLAPSGLTATAISSTGIGLTWVDNSDNEAGFKIERKKAGTTTFALAATVGAGVTTYNNTTGLTANTQYVYRVRAYNFTSNYSAYCTEASATTWPLPPLAPTLLFPAAGAVNVSLPTYVDWNDCTGANTYGVQISTVSTFTSTVVNLAGLGTSIYTIPMGILSPNTLYYWRANATDGFGGTSRWSALRSFRTAP